MFAADPHDLHSRAPPFRLLVRACAMSLDFASFAARPRDDTT